MPAATAPAIALNRFGLGARPDETPPSDPRAALLAQFDRYQPRPASWAALPDSASIGRDYVDQRREMQAMAKEDAERKDARKEIRQDGRQLYRDAANARLDSALATDTPFVERLVHFWANHFAVSADKITVIPFIGAYEAEAIRPHVLGRFEDLLLASVRHPAMLLYLDQAQSIGPDSPAAQRISQRQPGKMPGLNENLAREIMELHTLGVRSGYSQADVTEFARALTGWSIGGFGRGGGEGGADAGDFIFRANIHEPGSRTIFGRRYDQPGEAQARAVIRDLATAPQTATHVATKLSRHFVSDDPPAALVERLAAAFTRSGGDLPSVYRALVEAPEAWAPAPAKFKTPWEWLVSASRGLGMRQAGEVQAINLMQQLGQPLWRPGSPAGYDDIAASWAAPDALVRRVEMAQRMAMRVGDRLDPRQLGPRLLPGMIAPATAQAIAGAESPAAGIALLLVAPEFQRR